ncbi:sensor histidine kinase [Paenibacillus sp. XY044]|uniref:sensor histidine kinase n=1 Tax=Paenibacillus sp. XY044 TaxID=2026089 RepID=UPI000B988D2F|nr:sensor histidine kinase [Paenibacillus sp. XY044]OZB90798.1 sensor histidine kinase [Paenibacillus sp. XY044]
MKASRKYGIIAAMIFMAIQLVFAASCYGSSEPALKPLTDWRFTWEDGGIGSRGTDGIGPASGWEPYRLKQPLPPNTGEAETGWFETKLPALVWNTPAILLKPVYGIKIAIYVGQEKRYETGRDYRYDVNHILLPLSREDAGKTLLMQIQGGTGRIGLEGSVWAGDYQMLLTKLIRANLGDIVLGSSFIFIALIMLISALFLNRSERSSWLSLTIVILSIGLMILTYSPFVYSLFSSYGALFQVIFDLALLSLLPAITYYFEKTIGPGYMRIIRICRKIQAGYSLFCLGLMVVNLLSGSRFSDIYYFFSVTVLGCLMIALLMILAASAISYAMKGNRNAAVFATGFALFAVTALGELVWFYVRQGDYVLFWWKWGVLGFVISLIMILGRKFAHNHQQIVVYSRELEMFNSELQRSEKMEIISELAASVAHEVRNPLQVTRGFLQLLQEKSRDREKEYLRLALEELDRASGIITDFLTFAKPEAEKVALLDVRNEFRHIEGILIPLANLQGGRITTDIPKGLYVQGNSSKFKQAFINMIKNSIEALREEGHIEIRAYRENDQVVIRVADNGEGMEPSEVARLGEPYYSNKSKGTGLGLMVTFRIIEVMQGKIDIESEKGAGTMMTVRFPASVPDGEGLE